jgi:cyclopropane-fatty-acyl-phospholipid synthase
MFRSAKCYTHLFQIVFSKGNATSRSYPMSREFLYAQPAYREDPGASRAA